MKQAYRNLMALGEEKIRFLSARRCRHFLAAIAPQLLEAIGRGGRSRLGAGEPRQGERLAGRQGRALGAVQLQSAQPAAVRRTLRLQPLPVGHPHQQPRHDRRPDGQPGAGQAAQRATRCGQTLAELCRGAEDIDPILHSFKNDQQLRVGVRDLLGKEDVQATTGALSDIAETCLAQIAAAEYERLAAKFGRPRIAAGPRAGQPCEMVVLAMGKFGGREMNYHSDLDIVFLYEADGQTAGEYGRAAAKSPPTSISSASWDSGSSRPPATWAPTAGSTKWTPGCAPPARAARWPSSRQEFARYFAEGSGQLWERQALCKARRGVRLGRARAARPRRPSAARPSATAGAARTPRRSATCGTAWKRPPPPAT